MEQQMNYNANDVGKYTPAILYMAHKTKLIQVQSYLHVNHTQSPHLVEMTLDQQTEHRH